MERIPRGRERDRDLLLLSPCWREVGSELEEGGKSEEFRPLLLSLGGELGVGRESKWEVGVRGGGGGAGEEERERGLNEGRAKGVLKTILREEEALKR